MIKKTREIPVAEFEAHCLALLDEVRDQQEEIVVTKRGKPVAKVVPMPEPQEWRHLKGSLLWQADDIISPIDEVWDAESAPTVW